MFQIRRFFYTNKFNDKPKNLKKALDGDNRVKNLDFLIFLIIY